MTRRFFVLEKNLREAREKSARQFILKNNYRTAANIMKRMDKYFGQWGKDKLLQYDGPVIPFNTTAGTMKMIPSYMNQEEEDELIADTAREQLEALIKR